LKGEPNKEQQATLKKKRDQVIQNMPYFGYGYIRNANDLVPYIPVCFYAFRIMVGLGCLLILFFLVTGHFVFRKDLARYRWLLVSSIVMLPLAYLASESGWLVGRIRSATLDHSGYAPHVCSRFRSDVQCGCADLPGIPHPLYDLASGGNQYSLQTDQERSGTL
jgi:hypothetical protein